MTLDAQLQAALVGAGATFGAAVIGFGAIVWQLGRQARSAIAQQRDNEATRLKLELYKDIIQIAERVSNSALGLVAYARSLVLAIENAKSFASHGQPYSVPTQRMLELSRLQSAAHLAGVEIISTVERWRIVDTRMSVFQTAINVALHELMEANLDFFSSALPIAPIEGPVAGQVFPWSIPSDEKIQAAKVAFDKLEDASGLLGVFVSDFRDAMQIRLLTGLFEGKLVPRRPMDPRYVVVTLEKHEELTRYFETETAWGRSMAAAERRAADALQPKQLQS